MTNTDGLLKDGARRRESGQIFALVAMSLVVLLGFASLAVDVGFLWNKRRQMQTAADAAAIGGMRGLAHGSVVADALRDAKLNNFQNGTNSIKVTINNPPASGIYAGDPNAVEAIISQPVPTYFMRVLGFASVPVQARAVAHITPPPDCIYILNPSASGALTVGGSGATLNAKCGIQVNSTSSKAMNINGGACVTAAAIGIVGNYSAGGCPPTPTPVTGVVAATDPLEGLAAPTPGNCIHTGIYKITSSLTLNQGTYCGGISITGAGTTVVFNPGVYILNGGGLAIGSNANVQGTDVTFYNTGTKKTYAPFNVAGGDTTSLSAPNSGPYEGILFFNDRTITGKGSTITGSSNTVFQGTLYFPTTALAYGGGSTSSAYNFIVADTLSVQGSATLNAEYSGLDNQNLQFKWAGLGE
jgi:Flp pilus assembly protein TadG